jgi:hypothetical protein
MDLNCVWDLVRGMGSAIEVAEETSRGLGSLVTGDRGSGEKSALSSGESKQSNVC